jgi:D-glycero-D-manno-heptose 1,7-bisphosphate phosphatase
VEPYAFACSCRKPLPGLLLAAARDFAISLPDSWMIGDILNDMEAGKRAGCRTILVNNGNETEWRLDEFRKPDHMVEDLKEAAGIILSSHHPVI